MRHHELIKFAIVGGTTFIIDMAIFYSLTLSFMENKPVIARVISGVVATIASYFLNREWAFRDRGGRQPHQEMILFFVISGIGVVLAAAPLWVANNLFDIRHGVSTTSLVLIDFVLGFILGNILQMAFRFWALRKFAFPDELAEELAPIPLHTGAESHRDADTDTADDTPQSDDNGPTRRVS